MLRYWTLILILAASWGASYLFIKLTVDEIAPGPAMLFRVVVAGLMLLVYAFGLYGVAGTFGRLRDAWRACFVLGALNAAIPFWLVGWGETHIDSSIAAIAQASVPIFNLLLGLRFLPHEPVTGLRVTGLVTGLVGVALVAGAQSDTTWWAVVGALAVVLASVSYAGGGIYGQLRIGATPGPILAVGSMLTAAVYLVPLAVADFPTEMPSAGAWAALLALTVLGTALAQIVLFKVLESYGAARLALVSYLIPVFALAYGVTLLDEPLTVAAVGGLALILGGVALASGALRPRRRAEVAA